MSESISPFPARSRRLTAKLFRGSRAGGVVVVQQGVEERLDGDELVPALGGLGERKFEGGLQLFGDHPPQETSKRGRLFRAGVRAAGGVACSLPSSRPLTRPFGPPSP